MTEHSLYLLPREALDDTEATGGLRSMTDDKQPLPAAISEFHDQDCLIVIEALAVWGGNPNALDSSDPQKARAWNFMSTIGSSQLKSQHIL